MTAAHNPRRAFALPFPFHNLQLVVIVVEGVLRGVPGVRIIENHHLLGRSCRITFFLRRHPAECHRGVFAVVRFTRINVASPGHRLVPAGRILLPIAHDMQVAVVADIPGFPEGKGGKEMHS